MNILIIARVWLQGVVEVPSGGVQDNLRPTPVAVGTRASVCPATRQVTLINDN